MKNTTPHALIAIKNHLYIIIILKIVEIFFFSFKIFICHILLHLMPRTLINQSSPACLQSVQICLLCVSALTRIRYCTELAIGYLLFFSPLAEHQTDFWRSYYRMRVSWVMVLLLSSSKASRCDTQNSLGNKVCF